MNLTAPTSLTSSTNKTNVLGLKQRGGIMLKYVDYNIVFQEIPDETVLAVNLSNCPNHCHGCHSPYLLEDTGEALTEEVLLTLLGKYGKAVICICFMGGDAFPHEVERLAGFLHRQTMTKIKVGWYSGKPELPSALLLDRFEYIKLGPNIDCLGGLTSRSTNQRLFKIENSQPTDMTSRFWK